MKGAREYAELFKTGQYGRLYIVSSEHARGKTFRIWVLPANVVISTAPWSTLDAVEVYGITEGHPGWTEAYGWLHRGKWEADFANLVERRRAEIAENTARQGQEKADAEAVLRQRQKTLLDEYC